jgi:hypothetical protein
MPPRFEIRTMTLLIGTPNNRGLISTIHFQMVLSLMDHMRAKRPSMPVQHKVASCAISGFGRNVLASTVMADPSYSHLLLIDPDLSIPAEHITAMIDFDKPVVACPYPTRDWDRQVFADVARKVEDVTVAEACAVTYVGGDDALIFTNGPGGRRPINKGAFARVNACGSGVLLIRRDAFDTIAARRPDLVSNKPASDYSKIGFTGDTVIECFEHAAHLPSHLAAEGVAFSRLWIDDCGGEIWTNMEATVMRQAEYRFVGHFASKLKFGMI